MVFGFRRAARILTLSGFSFALACSIASGQNAPSQAAVHHAVSTDNSTAQAAFDRGLLYYYAYNVEAAENEFKTATLLDPHLAMAYWGIALSNATNLNVPATKQRGDKALRAIEQAQQLEQYASPEEREYIEAARLRFAPGEEDSSDQLTHYRDAMLGIAQQNPGDPDAAALFSEASLYVATEGRANSKDAMTDSERASYANRVAGILPYLTTATARFPDHVGLLHFMIHAADEANRQRLGVTAAHRLAHMDLPPAASHLTHMPGHIFLKVGDYVSALDVAQRSVDMDVHDLQSGHPGPYAATRYYHGHNVDFLLVSLTELGHYTQAIDAAAQDGAPSLLARQLIADRRWTDILRIFPADSTADVAFARGLANAALGNLAGAQGDLEQIPTGDPSSPSYTDILQAMRSALKAGIAEREGDANPALALLADSGRYADLGDALSVAEFPAMYYYSPHLALAALAKRLGKNDLAETAYRAELQSAPGSPSAEYGLAHVHDH